MDCFYIGNTLKLNKNRKKEKNAPMPCVETSTGNLFCCRFNDEEYCLSCFTSVKADECLFQPTNKC